jgi:hypothetical protein
MQTFHDKLGDDGIGQIWSYTSEPVRLAVDALLDVVDNHLEEHHLRLHELKGIEESRPEVMKALFDSIEWSDEGGPAADREAMEKSASSVECELELLDAIAERSDLDVSGLIALCDKVIDVARDDLQGRSGTKKSD